MAVLILNIPIIIMSETVASWTRYNTYGSITDKPKSKINRLKVLVMQNRMNRFA